MAGGGAGGRHALKAAIFAAALCLASMAGAGERWLERPETGPVAVSIANELSQVYRRAEVWLGARKWKEDGGTVEEEGLEGKSADELWALATGGSGMESLVAAAAVARVLDEEGAEVVFLAGGEAVEWRKALVRAVVAKQRVDPATGGGYWAETRTDSEEKKLRATRLALDALSVASGVAF